ncbi:hypothetical protein KFL_005560010 [Klebsormidium nitens]|uniref:RING-type domain-containing protein n=1 Tax=Klebsormidium nitens TaxID=105231 RepID=A0A1Y1II20_KLENI|nr:hypothetical protein KFL_005560010 [Klebsormidium nitens]|eukprot:GAQ89722.1 hypothetical protein KFL_005560010 [Klebsormidium nitens]
MEPDATATLIDELMARISDLEVQANTLSEFHTLTECSKLGTLLPKLIGSRANAVRKHYAGSTERHVLVSFDHGRDGLDPWAYGLYARFLRGEFPEVTNTVVRNVILAVEEVTPYGADRPHWCDVHSGELSPHTYVRNEIVSRIMMFLFPEVGAFDGLLRKFVLSFDEPTDVREVCNVTERILEFLGEHVEENVLDIYAVSPEVARIADVLLAGDFVRGEEEDQFWDEIPDTVGPDQKRPRAFKNTFSQAFGWIDDLTPYFVRHSSAEIARSIGAEYPHHTIYYCRGDSVIDSWMYNGKELWARYRANRLEKPKQGAEDSIHLLLEGGAEVVSEESAVSLCNNADARMRIRGWKHASCVVCWNGFQDKPSACVMQCCFQLMCAACSREVVATIGTCPICRENIRAADGIKQVFDDVDPQTPMNVSFAPHGYLDNRPYAWFKRILSRLRPNAKVIVYVDHSLSFRCRFDMDLEYFMGREGGIFQAKQLSGNRYQMRHAVEYFNSETRDPNVRKGIILTQTSMGHGCSLHKATDLLVLSPASSATYAHLISRVVNAKSPRVDEDMPLRVHVLHTPGRFMPDLQLARPEGSGSGMEWRKMCYKRAMEEQKRAVDLMYRDHDDM